MPDKYDEQIAELLKDEPTPKEFSKRVNKEWGRSRGLFAFAASPGFCEDYALTGCLTMIREGSWIAETPELTLEIKQDERIPTSWSGITPEHLPIFAEWQRRLDRELNREPQL